MRRQKFVARALALMLCVFACRPAETAETAKPSIFEGDVVPAEDAPGVVSLLTPELRSFCTGVVVAPHWVLTASHCFRNLDLSESSSARNSLIYSESEDKTYSIKNLFLSEFKTINTITIAANGNLSDPAFDLALVELNGTAFDADAIYRIAPVDVEKTWRRMRTSLTAYGYGLYDTQKSDDRLRMGLDFLWIGDWGLHGTETYLSSAQALCSGDSGGPLIAKTANGSKLVYGIAIRGTNFYDTAGGKCGYDDSIFTRLTHPKIRQWITDSSRGAVPLN